MSDEPKSSESQVRMFGQDVSVRGVVVVLLVLTTCAMSVTGIEVKEPMYSLSLMSVGWYFGQKKTT